MQNAINAENECVCVCVYADLNERKKSKWMHICDCMETELNKIINDIETWDLQVALLNECTINILNERRNFNGS